MSQSTAPVRVDAYDALAIFNRYIIEAEQITDPKAREPRLEKARYWRRIADRLIEKDTVQIRRNLNREHAYTSDAEGNLVPLSSLTSKHRARLLGRAS